jgi:DNA-binding transcriptional LysR family regulator
VTPTKEGDLLYEKVAATFQSIEEIERYARKIRDHIGAQLTIGTGSTFTTDVLPIAIRKWNADWGSINLTVEQYESEQIIHWVRARRVDIGIVSPIYDISGVHEIDRRELRYVLLSPAGPEDAERGALNLSDIDAKNIIVPGRFHLLSRIADRDAANRLEARIGTDAYISSIAGHLVRHGEGVAIVDELTAGFFRQSFGCIIHPIRDAPRLDVTVITQDHPSASTSARHLGACIIEAIDERLGKS